VNDDRLRRILVLAEQPVAPDRAFADDLLGRLRAEVAGADSAAAVRPLGPAPTVTRAASGRGVAWLLAAAALVGLLLAIAAAAGAFRNGDEEVPAIGDVPIHRVDLGASLVMPGPPPTGTPVEAWHKDLGQTTGAPIVVGGLVVATGSDRVVAVDARTGTQRWQFELPGPAADAGSTPGAAAGLVYVTDSAALYALDAATGVRRWTAAAPNSTARPKVADGVVYVATTAGAAGFDALTGAPRWTWIGPAGGTTNFGPIADGVAFLSAADGRLHAIALSDAHEVWSVATISSGVGSSEVVGDTVYVATTQNQSPDPQGELLAVDRASGAIRWRFRGPSGLQVSAGAVRDGVIYVASEADGLIAIRDEGSAARQLWRVESPRSYFPVSIAGDELFVQRFDGSIGAHAAADGRLLWQTPALGSNGTGSPVVTGGIVFGVTERGGLRAFADPRRVAPPSASVAAAAESEAASPSSPTEASPLAVIRSFGWDRIGLATPLGMAPGPDGLLYVLDTKPSVTVIDPADGRVVRTWGRQGSGPGEFDTRRVDDNPGYGDIAVTPDGRVFVADGANRRVQVFEPDGTFLAAFGTAGDATERLSQVTTIAIGPTGDVYVADLNDAPIVKFRPDGTFVWRGPALASDPNVPIAPSLGAIRRDGVIVATAEGTGRLVLIDPADGRIQTTIPLPQLVGDGFGILSLDPSERVYIQAYASSAADPVMAAILAFDPDGAFLGGLYRPAGARPPNEATTVTYGDWVFPTPVFMPDGRAFTFSELGLTEIDLSGLHP
jgi:outer membrane protein assembly factor BamB